MEILKNKKTKVWMLILILLMQIALPVFTILVENSLTPTSIAAETGEWDVSANEDGSVKAVLDETGTLTISGTGTMTDWTFWGPWNDMRSSIVKVNIESGVQNIGNNAFYYCTNLTSITMTEDVKSIGKEAFYECNSLASITIPTGLTSIAEGTFWNCDSLTNIIIPEGVLTIGEYAFVNCNALVSVSIPETVNVIGNSAFSGCKSLSAITLPSGITSIGSSLFSGCSRLVKMVIPSGVTSIGDEAFSDCTSLTSITIPDGVTSIGGKAFYECTSLPNITIPDTVISIGARAFYQCDALTKITIPEGVMSIGEYCFAFSDNLTSIAIPSSLMSIGENAFCSCRQLKTIAIPDSVVSIGASAFANCENLTIYCRTGSEAENYCKTNELVYEIDDEAPVINSTVVKVENEQAVLTVNATDSKAGLAAVAYSFDGGATWQAENTKTYTEETAGVAIQVRDFLGNVATATKDVSLTETLQTEFVTYGTEEEEGVKYLINVNPKTSITKALKDITTNGTIKIYKGTTEVTDNGTILATGMKIEITLGSEKEEYIIVVRGDTTGDGQADIKDILSINKHRLDKVVLAGAYLKAGNVAGDANVDIMDILQINKFRLGKIENL